MAVEKKRILVVEDDESLSRALEIKLLQDGFRVDIAKNGREALSAIDRSQPDGILLDLVMPVMDGVDFLKAVRLEMNLKIPVVVLTVLTSGILFDQCKALDLDGYFIKDQVSLDEVIKVVDTAAT